LAKKPMQMSEGRNSPPPPYYLVSGLVSSLLYLLAYVPMHSVLTYITEVAAMYN
jgi:hypothetical protein